MDYNRLVPHDSFMGRYLSYMANQETAYAYDWWCGLWCISSAIARRSYVNRPRAPVYLNLYLILVGDSGVARKTASVSVARRVVHNLLSTVSDLALLDDKVTPEKLDELLHNATEQHGNAQLCIAVPELAVFLGTERYIAHMPTLLTDLYDCPAQRFGGGTITRGSVIQHNVWINLLSASTPIWLLKTVNPNVVEGGFTSRCYFIVANEPKRQIPWPEDSDPLLFKDLCEDARIIAAEATKHPTIGITDGGRKHFTDWYAARPRSIDPFKQSFESREDAHVLRIAALLCVNDGSWSIDAPHVECAITLLAGVKHTSGTIFETAEAKSKFAQGLDILRTYLITQGMDPLPRSRLYIKCRHQMSFLEFQSLIDVLDEMGAIQRFELKQARGRPTEYIRGTDLLMKRGIGDAVLERFS